MKIKQSSWHYWLNQKILGNDFAKGNVCDYFWSTTLSFFHIFIWVLLVFCVSYLFLFFGVAGYLEIVAMQGVDYLGMGNICQQLSILSKRNDLSSVFMYFSLFNHWQVIPLILIMPLGATLVCAVFLVPILLFDWLKDRFFILKEKVRNSRWCARIEIE